MGSALNSVIFKVAAPAPVDRPNAALTSFASNPPGPTGIARYPCRDPTAQFSNARPTVRRSTKRARGADAHAKSRPRPRPLDRQSPQLLEVQSPRVRRSCSSMRTTRAVRGRKAHPDHARRAACRCADGSAARRILIDARRVAGLLAAGDEAGLRYRSRRRENDVIDVVRQSRAR